MFRRVYICSKSLIPSFLYETHLQGIMDPQGIMVVVLNKINIQSKMKITTTMIHCRRISSRELAIGQPCCIKMAEHFSYIKTIKLIYCSLNDDSDWFIFKP